MKSLVLSADDVETLRLSINEVYEFHLPCVGASARELLTVEKLQRRLGEIVDRFRPGASTTVLS